MLLHLGLIVAIFQWNSTNVHKMCEEMDWGDKAHVLEEVGYVGVRFCIINIVLMTNE